MTSPMASTEPATPTRESRRSLESAAETGSVRTGTGRSSPASSEVVKDKEEEEVNLEVGRLPISEGGISC